MKKIQLFRFNKPQKENENAFEQSQPHSQYTFQLPEIQFSKIEQDTKTEDTHNRVTEENFQSFYAQGVQDGFEVVDVRHYYVPSRYDDILHPEVEQMMATPWVCDGRPVFGYTVTNVDSADERRRGSRDTYAHEFWIYDSEKGMPRKVDDIYPNGYRLNNADGKDVSVTEAVNQMKKFATAATYHPHVFMAPEFTEARNYVNGRFGLPPVTAKDYETYLRENIRRDGHGIIGQTR